MIGTSLRRAQDDPFAVLLNPNARRVGRRVVDRVTEYVDPAHVFVSRDEREADAIAREIIRRGYETVFAGGGDGTVTQLMNHVPDGGPRVGILRLGTGNAMAEIVSSGDPLTDLRTFVTNPSQDSVTLPLCEAEGTRFAFAGLGLDAAILNDFETLRGRVGARRLVQNVGGYVAAALGITLPRMTARWLRRQRPQVRVTNLGAEARAIALNEEGTGEVVATMGPGEVLYEGPVNSALFGTCPYYGYGMKILPFAGVDPTRFHLRLSNVPVGRLLTGVRGLWRGTLRHDSLVDFHVQRVHLAFSEPMPYQLAGEAQGLRRELEVGLSDAPVDLVRFI